ncbi:hypothetical protein F5J12DRAFT_848027 [Pisolithus orientalis]|uniref:uncharacterized protein n=1 Tax=Pisolithus orientalis TaxID=936130 RepID=UPI0022249282|nr:uncharacterized protein F5J12DRAFT_848027 [Pisolithus orientalis]KAI5999397.1 hypothetical protein F5J12DRAFT_848027 [Pisolithus orientalis]
MANKKKGSAKKKQPAEVSVEIPAAGSSSAPSDSSPPKEAIKEQGNSAFKAKQYTEAVELYTKAIDMSPAEPSYLTNRAAAHMALKRFRPALVDCQQAATLQSDNPSSKTLIRLARCQLALGESESALKSLCTALSLEPSNTTALQLQGKVQELERHLRNFDSAKRKRDWGLGRLALDKCFQSMDAEGGEAPIQWRLWRIELELGRANWDAANIAANDLLRLEPNSPEVLTLRGLLLFLSGKLPASHTAHPGHGDASRLRKRIKDVERLKEEGNTAFKSGKLQDAVDRYTEALERIGDAEEEGKGGQIRATLLSNRATTQLKLERYEEALADTEASLTLCSTSFKALRTRARINLHLEKLDAAVADFKAAIEQAGVEGADADARTLRVDLKKAEAALKRSKTKDYYKILGLSRDCIEADIKKAYRRESLKHHPDKGGDEEKFKLVVEAHAVLSDPQRRQRYDMGEDEDGQTDPSMGGMNGFRMNHADLASLFAQFDGGPFGGGGRGQFGGGGGFRFHTSPMNDDFDF